MKNIVYFVTVLVILMLLGVLIFSVGSREIIVATPPLITENSPIEYLDSFTISHNKSFENTPIGGLSGIDYDLQNNTYWVISDDKSKRADARAYQIVIDLDKEKQKISGINFEKVVYLKDKSGLVFARDGVDAESIRVVANHLMWTSETDTPMLREMDLSGNFIREFDIPTYFYPAKGAGLRDNTGFESLASSPDSKHLYIASQNTLKQDGEEATSEAQGSSRLLQYRLPDGALEAEYHYAIDPIPLPDGFTLSKDKKINNDVSEILSLGSNQFLFLERSYFEDFGNSISIYKATVPDAAGKLQDSDRAVTLEKELLLHISIDLRSIGVNSNLKIDNMEGMTFGPRLADGRQSLILVSDNNFDIKQKTLFMLFALSNQL